TPAPCTSPVGWIGSRPWKNTVSEELFSPVTDSATVSAVSEAVPLPESCALAAGPAPKLSHPRPTAVGGLPQGQAMIAPWPGKQKGVSGPLPPDVSMMLNDAGPPGAPS